MEQRILCWYCWSSEFGDNNKVYTEPKELRELGIEPTPLKYLHPQAQGTVLLRIKSINHFNYYVIISLTFIYSNILIIFFKVLSIVSLFSTIKSAYLLYK